MKWYHFTGIPSLLAGEGITNLYPNIPFLLIFNQGTPKTGPCLTPAEVLIAIHGIDPVKDGIPLKKVCSPLLSY